MCCYYISENHQIFAKITKKHHFAHTSSFFENVSCHDWPANTRDLAQATTPCSWPPLRWRQFTKHSEQWARNKTLPHVNSFFATKVRVFVIRRKWVPPLKVLLTFYVRCITIAISEVGDDPAWPAATSWFFFKIYLNKINRCLFPKGRRSRWGVSVAMF